MKTKILNLVLLLFASLFILFVIFNVSLTFEQKRALIFALAVFGGLLVFSFINVVKEPAPEREKPKTVTYLDDEYTVVYEDGCTECHFLKSCHFLEDFEAATRFQNHTGINCMMDGCYFVKQSK